MKAPLIRRNLDTDLSGIQEQSLGGGISRDTSGLDADFGDGGSLYLEAFVNDVTQRKISAWLSTAN